MRLTPLLALLALCGCDEPAQLARAPGSTTPAYERVEPGASPMEAAITPVRIGEMGANFAACNARGTLRRSAADAGLPVRAAPFDAAHTVAELAPGATFFVCSRSLDQKWLGVVFDEGATAAATCGVSGSIPSARAYAGRCRSGWVASASVKLLA
jgi:hypothetical protein